MFNLYFIKSKNLNNKNENNSLNFFEKLTTIVKKHIKTSSEKKDNNIKNQELQTSEIIINSIDGAIDYRNIEHILQIDSWDEATIYKIIRYFRNIGITAKITYKNNQILIDLKGPSLSIHKKPGKDPLGVGDTNAKKYNRIPQFSKVERDFDNFWHGIESFIFSYGTSTGRKVTIIPLNPNVFFSKIKIKEEKIPIHFVIEDFIDLYKDPSVLAQIFHLLWINNSVRSENPVMRFFEIALKDSSHFVSNLGKKEKESLINSLKYLGYINAKLVEKTTIQTVNPKNECIKTGVVYSLFLGKKSKIRNIILNNTGLSSELHQKIKNTIEDVFLSSSFSIQSLQNIDKILSKLNVKCIKNSILQISDIEYDLYFEINYKEQEKFFQEINFRNVPFPYAKLLKLASHSSICIGTSVENKSINSFVSKLESISGRKIDFNQEQERGSIVTFTAGSKPKTTVPCEQLLHATQSDGIIISLFQTRKFFIMNKLFKLQITWPEFNISLSDFSNFIKNIKIGTKVELDYLALNGLKINTTLNLRIKPINEAIEFLKHQKFENNPFEIEAAINFYYSDFVIFLSTQKTANILANILSSDFYENDFSLSGGASYSRDFLDGKYNKNIYFGVKSFCPLNLIKIVEKNAIGANLKGEFNIEYNFLNNYMLCKTLFSYSPIISKGSAISTNGEYRIPGYFHKNNEQIGDLIALIRFCLMTTVWDSSTLFMKMMSLSFGFLAQGGFINSINRSKTSNLKEILNTGIIITLDLMGVFAFFFSFTINIYGELTWDFGVIFNMNPFLKDRTTDLMMS